MISQFQKNPDEYEVKIFLHNLVFSRPNFENSEFGARCDNFSPRLIDTET